MSVNLKIYLFIFYLSSVCLGLSKRGYEYHYEIQGYLKLHRKPADRSDAEFICRREGAVLVAPWSPEFTAAVNKLQKPSEDEETELQKVLSGAVEIFPDGLFSRYSRRLPGVLLKTQRCVAFFADGTTGDVDCEDELPFVCFAPFTSIYPPEDTTSTTNDQTSTTKNTTSITKDTMFELELDSISTARPTTEDPRPACETSGYVYSSVTGHCYNFHKDAKNWRFANLACKSEGGYLAVINSKEEASFLCDLYQGVMDSDIKNASYTHFAAIGIKKTSNGSWKTIDGQLVEEAGYSNWRPDEPKDKQIGHWISLVGYMYRDGTLISFCDAGKTAFICEIGV